MFGPVVNEWRQKWWRIAFHDKSNEYKAYYTMETKTFRTWIKM